MTQFAVHNHTMTTQQGRPAVKRWGRFFTPFRSTLSMLSAGVVAAAMFAFVAITEIAGEDVAVVAWLPTLVMGVGLLALVVSRGRQVPALVISMMYMVGLGMFILAAIVAFAAFTFGSLGLAVIMGGLCWLPMATAFSIGEEFKLRRL